MAQTKSKAKASLVGDQAKPDQALGRSLRVMMMGSKVVSDTPAGGLDKSSILKDFPSGGFLKSMSKALPGKSVIAEKMDARLTPNRGLQKGEVWFGPCSAYRRGGGGFRGRGGDANESPFPP